MIQKRGATVFQKIARDAFSPCAGWVFADAPSAGPVSARANTGRKE
jgi:hypothetical protein